MHTAPDSNEHLSKGIDLSATSLDPSSFSFLDMSMLQVAAAQIAEKLLTKLCEGPTTVAASIPLMIQEGALPERVGQLRSIQLKLEDLYQSEVPLYLGYPIVNLDNEHGQLSHCPVFIWPVVLELMPDRSRFWKISCQVAEPPKIHPLLEKQLAKVIAEDASLPSLKSGYDATLLSDICNQVATLLNLKVESAKLICPYDVQDYLILNRVSKAFLLGGFVQEDLETLELPLKETNDATEETKAWRFACAALRINSAQNKAIEALFNGNHLSLQGPTLSGKTQVVSASIPALLSEGKTLLYLVDDQAQGQMFLHTLKGLGLHHLGCLTMHADLQDNKAILDFLSNLKQQSKKKVAFDALDFQKNWHQLLNLHQRLELAFDAVKMESLANYHWSDLVGQYLKANHKSNQAILQAALSKDSFEFSSEEYHQIALDLKEHYPHFKAIKSLNHPLQSVHQRFFEGKESYELLREELKVKLHLYQHKFRSLYQQIVALKEAHKSCFYFQLIDFAHRVVDRIDQLINRIQFYQQLYGDDFDKQGNWQDAKLKLLALFSKKFAALRFAKKELSASCESLQLLLEKQRFKSVKVPVFAEAKRMRILLKMLKDFRELIVSKIDNTIPENQTDAFLIPSESMQTDSKEAFELLYSKCRQAFKQFNQDKWQNKTIDWENSIEEDYLMILRAKLEELEVMEERWDEFKAFYNWKSSWLALKAPTKQLIEAFIQMRLDNWDAAFRAWYLYQVIHDYYRGQLPAMKLRFSDAFETYIQCLESVQQQLVAQANTHYFEQIKQTLKQLKKEKALALSKVKKVFEDKALSELLKWLGKDHITTVFPIVVAHPESLDSLSALGLEFDLMVFDLRDSKLLKLAKNFGAMAPQHVTCRNKEDQMMKNEFNGSAATISEQNAIQIDLKPLPKLDKDDFSYTVGTALRLHQGIFSYLQDFVDPERVVFSATIQGLSFDIVVLAADESSDKKPFVIVCDRGIHLDQSLDIQGASDRLSMLQNTGYAYYLLSTDLWWKDTDRALQQLLVPFLAWDSK